MCVRVCVCIWTGAQTVGSGEGQGCVCMLLQTEEGWRPLGSFLCWTSVPSSQWNPPPQIFLPTQTFLLSALVWIALCVAGPSTPHCLLAALFIKNKKGSDASVYVHGYTWLLIQAFRWFIFLPRRSQSFPPCLCMPLAASSNTHTPSDIGLLWSAGRMTSLHSRSSLSGSVCYCGFSTATHPRGPVFLSL